jgi:hypothetical protein
MATSKGLIRVVLAATIFWGAGCAASAEEPSQSGDQAAIQAAMEDGAGFEPATQDQIDDVTLDPQILFGCSNAQIRSAQAACRNTFCDTRGSNGIHFCDQRPPNVVAQCDCKTGADPTITCSLTSCPQ